MEKNNKRITNAWASYDWANSVYNLIVTTAIFPIYYSASTREAFSGNVVDFFGIQIKNTVLYTYAISFSFLVIVFLSPVLSGIADYTGRKKRFMQGFTYLGALSCIGLFFFNGSNVEYGIACSILASIGYAGSLVFYNAFLPEICTVHKMDGLSARGFSMGYIGSVILLIANLIIIMNPQSFGLTNKSSATKFGFLLVGFWWLGFSQIAFHYLKDYPTNQKISKSVLSKGIAELKKVFLQVKNKISLKRYLFSFLIYSMGVQTVMLLAPLFAESEAGFGADEMIIVVLILQLLAIGGAYLFSHISKLKGNSYSISITLIVWIFICVSGYFVNSKWSFYLLAALLGMVMGSIQSISRSTYSKLIPNSTRDTASFFSFYDVTEKLAIVVGTFSYALIEQITDNMRYSMVSMGMFFLFGLAILQLAGLKKELQK